MQNGGSRAHMMAGFQMGHPVLSVGGIVTMLVSSSANAPQSYVSSQYCVHIHADHTTLLMG